MLDAEWGILSKGGSPSPQFIIPHSTFIISAHHASTRAVPHDRGVGGNVSRDESGARANSSAVVSLPAVSPWNGGGVWRFAARPPAAGARLLDVADQPDRDGLVVPRLCVADGGTQVYVGVEFGVYHGVVRRVRAAVFAPAGLAYLDLQRNRAGRTLGAGPADCFGESRGSDDVGQRGGLCRPHRLP